MDGIARVIQEKAPDLQQKEQFLAFATAQVQNDAIQKVPVFLNKYQKVRRKLEKKELGTDTPTLRKNSILAINISKQETED